MTMKRLCTYAAVLVFAAQLMPVYICCGQESQAAPVSQKAPLAAPQPPEHQDNRGMNLLQLIKDGGIIGHIIIVLSFVAVALSIEYAYTIRPAKLAPPKDIAVIKKLIRENKIEEFKKMDQRKMSYLAKVVVTGLNDLNCGYGAMIQAMDDASEMLHAQIARKVEHLHLISNIAPLLGLLGTVAGLLRCCNAISQIRGAVELQQLAQGVFEALVTTAEGLFVGIPALYLAAVFRNRMAECTCQASLIAKELVTALKPSEKVA